MNGKQIRLFLVDGVPGGLTTLEITNWTGRLVSAPRSDLAVLSQREEAMRPGIYLLFGEDPTAYDGLRCYVGETDEIRGRLRQHDDPSRGKEFWTRVVIITSKDDNLTKAHTRYLESRLINMATQAKRCALDNGTAPPVSRLPEADVSDMEYFINQLHVALPVLGVNILRSAAPAPARDPAPTSPITSPDFHLAVPKRAIHATARQVDGEFTLLEGSVVAGSFASKPTHASSTQNAYAAYATRHRQLVADGSILVDGLTGRLTRDVVFPSASSAGAIVTGRSCNGRQAWQTADGTAFGAWEERGLDN